MNDPQSSSATAPTSRPRLISRNGRRSSVVRLGLERKVFSDGFHFLLVTSWPKVLFLIFLIMIAMNALFALAYLSLGDVIENAQPGSILDAFFFSVQTMATVGYGHLQPIGLAANVLSSFEAICGLLGFALCSGLLFAKFSRPTAKVMFSDVAVISRRNGRPCLMFRLANARGNQIIEGSLNLALIRTEVTEEGETIRAFHDLSLLRERSPVFTLTWTAVHFIDERSPLFGETHESLQRKEIEIIVTFTGLDETYAQNVHARHSFVASEIRWGHRFEDILSRAEGGQATVDYRKFHQTRPL